MMKTLSTLLGGIALFNLIRKIFDIGLEGVVYDLISYYQIIFYPIIEFINDKINWAIPDWNPDLILLIIFINANHAKIVARSIFLDHGLLQETKTENQLQNMGFYHSLKLGVIIPFAYLTGADLKFHPEQAKYSMKLPLFVATLFSYLVFMSVTLFIPYVRVVFVSFIALFISIHLLLSLLMTLRIITPADKKVKTKIKIFAKQYIYALTGAGVFFALNLYAPSI